MLVADEAKPSGEGAEEVVQRPHFGRTGEVAGMVDELHTSGDISFFNFLSVIFIVAIIRVGVPNAIAPEVHVDAMPAAGPIVDDVDR